MFRSFIFFAFLGSLSGGVYADSRPEVVLLSPTEDLGADAKKTTFPDGTVLANSAIFHSEASGVTVGRVALDGPALPKETIGYTDVFLVTGGAATVIGRNGKVSKIKAGDLIMLPRGLLLNAQEFRGYRHLFASFDTQKDFSVGGLKDLQRLLPEKLSRRDFVEAEGLLRHEYYTGPAGVKVEAERYPDESVGARRMRASDSRLMFIVSGSGAVVDGQGRELSLKPHNALLIPKGAEFQMSSRKLLTLTVVFDQGADAEGSQK